MMKTPEYLQKGDKIAMVATARTISMPEIEDSINVFNEWGLEVVLGKNIFKESNQFAGNDKERAEDFQNMLDDDSIKAIVCARGGYGSVRIIDNIDFSNFIQKPKWICGYSDITVFHSHINNNFGIETLHSVMPINFYDKKITKETFESFKAALFGENISYSFPTSSLSRKGICEADILGGNLSILYSLIGTKSDISTEGKILFIEDLDEYLYHIDRMIMNLKRGGKLEKLAGLVVGGMSEMNDNEVPFGKTAKEIIFEAVSKYNYPVCFDFPAGHINDNRALILGRRVRLEIDDKVLLKF